MECGGGGGVEREHIEQQILYRWTWKVYYAQHRITSQPFYGGQNVKCVFVCVCLCFSLHIRKFNSFLLWTAKYTIGCTLSRMEEIKCTFDGCMKVEAYTIHTHVHAPNVYNTCMYGYVQRSVRKLLSYVWNWICNAINSQRNWNYCLPFIYLFVASPLSWMWWLLFACSCSMQSSRLLAFSPSFFAFSKFYRSLSITLIIVAHWSLIIDHRCAAFFIYFSAQSVRST